MISVPRVSKNAWPNRHLADTLHIGMATNGFHFIGVGLYTVPEASRLTRVSTGRIRRWMRGYTFRTKSGVHASERVVTPALPLIDGAMTLSFLDLQEIRFVDAFIGVGVRWPTVRRAHGSAQKAFGTHPFSRGIFVTDGQRIFEDLARGAARSDSAFVDMVSNQMSFRRAVLPFMKTLRFADGQASEWWPLGKSKMVVLDPRRAFGQPIVAREGVPTNILARAYKAEQDFTRVARWFAVNERAVRFAIEYEASLLAA